MEKKNENKNIKQFEIGGRGFVTTQTKEGRKIQMDKKGGQYR
jgi:hypothetical protein